MMADGEGSGRGTDEASRHSVISNRSLGKDPRNKKYYYSLLDAGDIQTYYIGCSN